MYYGIQDIVLIFLKGQSFFLFIVLKDNIICTTILVHISLFHEIHNFGLNKQDLMWPHCLIFFHCVIFLMGNDIESKRLFYLYNVLRFNLFIDIISFIR